jgi:hypothetical protein
MNLVLISNFRRVLNVVFFRLGDSPASEFLYADVSEHSVSSIFIGGVSTTIRDSNQNFCFKHCTCELYLVCDI